MDLYAVLAQVSELLQRGGRVSYRALKVQFGLNDDQLEALKDELIEAKRLAMDERGRVLVWVGEAQPAEPPTTRTAPATPQPDAQPDHLVQSAPLATTSPEAVRHLTTALELLATLPEIPARVQQELDLLLALGPALTATTSFASPEVGQTYARARALCAQVGDTPQLLPTLWGLCRFYRNGGALPTARELEEQLCGWRSQEALALAQTLAHPLGLAVVQRFAVLLHNRRRDVPSVQAQAEARTMAEANEQGDMLAEAYRLQGEILLRQAVPDAAQAEACFQQALAIARLQQAKSWELRAAMSLSRLWQQQGKRAAARELLAPIYGWFTEGFDTADLQDAKALMAELA